MLQWLFLFALLSFWKFPVFLCYRLGKFSAFYLKCCSQCTVIVFEITKQLILFFFLKYICFAFRSTQTHVYPYHKITLNEFVIIFTSIKCITEFSIYSFHGISFYFLKFRKWHEYQSSRCVSIEFRLFVVIIKYVFLLLFAA